MKNKKYSLWLIALFCFVGFSKNIVAQEVDLKTAVNHRQILIGDAIELKLQATFNPTQCKINFPVINDTFNHFETIEKSKYDTIINREKNTITQTTIISNYDSGVWKIPSFQLQVLPLNGSTSFVKNSDSIEINVHTVEVDTTKPILPIMNIREAKMPAKMIALYVIGILIALTILFFLIRFLVKMLREKNKKPAKKINTIQLLPHEKALQSIEQLNQQQLWTQGQEKTYYTLLTDTIRTYLEEQFKMDVFEKTTSELMQQIKKQKALSTSRQNIRNLLETADLVKFAKSIPTEEENTAWIETAKEIVIESFKKVQASITTQQETNPKR